MKANIIIKITYLTIDNKEGELTLEPEQYFEEYSDIKKFTIVDAPKFSHAFEYLDIEPKELQNVKLIVKDQNDIKEHFYSFWNEGKNYSIATNKLYKNTKREGLIIFNVIEENPYRTEIIRFTKKDNYFIPSSHAIITDIDDKEETIEFSIYKQKEKVA